MGRFFPSDSTTSSAGWPLASTATGGPELGVIAAVAAAVGDGDDAACLAAWLAAESHLVAAGAPALLDELGCPKTLRAFTAAEGAGDHCEVANRSLANRRILDRLDETLGP